MKSHVIVFAALLSLPLIATAGNPPEPQGQPDYARGGNGWMFGSWHYKDSRAIHGRLLHDNKEVIGKRIGETLDTPIGTLVWRGNYSPVKNRDKSTGWLFVESFTGPPFIRDRYDPKTGVLP